jgi:hypothetical protein
MAQPQKKLSNILEFDDRSGGIPLGAMEIFLSALSRDEAIDIAQLTRIIGVLIEAENLSASERVKALGWIALIERARAQGEELKRMHARGELER